MDFIADMGALALGSRMKRLSERFFEEANDIYSHYDFELQARYFPLISYLYHHGPASVTEIASALHLTHPAVSQMAKALYEDGWIDKVIDPQDERRSYLELTDKANKLILELIPLWDRIEEGVKKLLGDEGQEFLGKIEDLEKQLDETKFSKTITGRVPVTEANVRVSTWDPAYKKAFHDLNEEWVRRFFKYEEVDRKMLQEPEKHILKSGGEIFFILYNGEVAGTGALIKTGEHSYELTKMAVSRKYQGLGLGRMLLEYILNWAKEHDAKEVTLETNSLLTGALKLYKHFGFKKLPQTCHKSEYERADVYMRKEF